MENSIDKEHKPRYKKCGVKYDIGVGILTKNPIRVTERDLKFYSPKLWIWYDGYWYLVKRQISLEDIGKECYSKEQFIEQLLSLI